MIITNLNLVDWIVLIFIILLFSFSLIYIIKHKHSCGDDCSGCPYQKNCHKK